MLMVNKAQKTQESIELLSVRDTSKLLGIHPNTLRQWDEKGILKAVRFGPRKDRRFRKSDIMKLIEAK